MKVFPFSNPSEYWNSFKSKLNTDKGLNNIKNPFTNQFFSVLKMESNYTTNCYSCDGVLIDFLPDRTIRLQFNQNQTYLASFITILYSLDIFDFDENVSVIKKNTVISINTTYSDFFYKLIAIDSCEIFIKYESEDSYNYNRRAIVFYTDENYQDMYFYDKELKKRELKNNSNN